MSSTRIKNDKNDFNWNLGLQKSISDGSMLHNKAYATNIGMPQEGILMGQMQNNILSNNATDVESFLKGINSTNLVEERQPVKPEFNKFKQINFYDKSNKVLLPNQLVIEKDQRFNI
jgi:hypothetical protein